MKVQKTSKTNKTLWFALAWIAAYVVVMSAAENWVNAAGTQSVRLIAACPLAAIVFAAGSKYGGLPGYGFASMKSLPWKKLLYALPLVLISTENLWHGVAFRMSARETFCYIVSMLCVGFLEELIFRGFLLKALLPDGERFTVLITGITFGLGHIVNLLHGAEVVPTLLQLCYAVAIGIMLGVLAVRTGNIVPGCIFHVVFNALGVFAARPAQNLAAQIVESTILVVLCLGYGFYLWGSLPGIHEKA